ncbi:ABC transporter permease [Candidatus Micrarchaeota archaeon]|nr:ABC transporter permease [Candidatus Micrarchaeota archaeon]
MVLRDIRKVIAFVRKEVISAMSYRYAFMSSIAFSLISLLFYFTMAGIFKAAIIPTAIPYGGDYLAFLITGAILWQMVTFGLYSISSAFTIEMITGTFEMIYVSRANLLTLLLGVSLFSLLTNAVMIVMSLGLAVAIFGVSIHLESIPLALFVLFLTYLSMLGIGMVVAGITVVTKSVGQVVSIITMLMAAFCGVLIPVELLPPEAKALSQVFPVTYALDALRNVLLNGTGLEGILTPIAILVGMALILIPIGYQLFFICLNIAKKQGTLGQF